MLHIKYINSGTHGFREKKSFSHYKSMGGNDPQGVDNLDPRGVIGRIYVGTTKHCYILNLYSLGLMVSEKKIFEGSLGIHFI